MNKDSDQYCINQILEGHTHEFTTLVNRYKDFVFTLILKMVRNREEAEEISQDVFLKVYKSIDKFKGESKFSTWIYRIAYNTCLDFLKKNKLKKETFTIDEIFDSHQLASVESFLDAMAEHEKNQTIKECMNLLDPEDGFLLTLHYFEEQSLKEIAKIIGVKENNVKIRLFRSRKKLALFLNQKLKLQ